MGQGTGITLAAIGVKTSKMKRLWITLGTLAAAAGVVYLLKDNEKVKGTLDKINDTNNDALGRWSKGWKRATDQFNKTAAGQA